MTDKQINKFSDLTFTQFFGYDLVATFNNNSKIKELQEQLKAKEQECEKKSWEIGNLGYKIKNQRKEINIRLEQLDQLKAKLELFKKSNITTIDQLKAELEQEKALKETYLACYKAKHEDIEGELFKLKQTLTEIKPILEFYANSKVGEEQPDGTYKLSGGIWDSFGFCTTIYDPRPAREGLKKISECEVENEQ